MSSEEAVLKPRREASVRQLEHVQRRSRVWRLDFRRDRSRHVARTAAAESSRHRDVLLVADGKRDRETLHRGTEPRLPSDLSGLHVECAEAPIEIADEGEAAGRG